MYDMELLPTKTSAELIEIGAAYGVPLNKSMKKTDMMQIIQVVHNSLIQNKAKPAEKPVFKSHETSQDEIIAECKKYASKGLELRFTEDGANWHIRCKGAEESGTRFQPFKAIAFRIKEVSKGARSPRVLKGQDGRVLLTA